MANLSGGRTLRIALSVLMMVTWAFVISASAQNRRYTGGITVFTNPNFTGQSASFNNDMPDLRGYNLNDKISSLEIPNGESWEVCQDINYGNRCQVFTGSVSDLRSMGWNDRISSLRRVNSGYGGRRTGGVYSPNGPVYSPNGSYGAQRLVLYDRPNFRGNAMTLNGNENGGLGNRLVGSAQVRGGSWELCDRSGRCATVSQDVPDLSRLGLNGRITAARPVYDNYNDNGRDNRGRGYGRRQD
jgi:beta/gamma crystallin